MPRTRKDEAPIMVDEPVIEARYVELDEHTVGFETFHADFDPAPLFHGLPDDRCQCPHWGYVLAGQITMRYVDHEETFRAGDAYYIAPGHLPLVHAGASVVEFSPTVKLNESMAVVASNMAAAAQSPS